MIDSTLAQMPVMPLEIVVETSNKLSVGGMMRIKHVQVLAPPTLRQNWGQIFAMCTGMSTFSHTFFFFFLNKYLLL